MSNVVATDEYKTPAPFNPAFDASAPPETLVGGAGTPYFLGLEELLAMAPPPPQLPPIPPQPARVAVAAEGAEEPQRQQRQVPKEDGTVTHIYIYVLS